MILKPRINSPKERYLDLFANINGKESPISGKSRSVKSKEKPRYEINQNFNVVPRFAPSIMGNAADNEMRPVLTKLTVITDVAEEL